MKFDDYTKGWFDGIADWAKANDTEMRPLLRLASLKPSRKNVVRFTAELHKTYQPFLPGQSRFNLKHATALALLHCHCIDVLNRDFKSEFHYAFGEITAAESFKTHFRKVSAASELFSLARQAFDY